MPYEMKPLQKPQESQQTSGNQSTMQVSDDSQTKQQNSNASEAPPDEDIGPASASSNEKRVTKEDIQIVQNLIKGCLLKYMNRNEVIKTLWNRECIDPVFTTLVWQKLEEQNAEFFNAYYIRLELIKQIGVFNQLLECQYDMMQNLAPPKAQVIPIQNRMNPVPANIVPMSHAICVPHPTAAADHPPQPTGTNSGTVVETSSAPLIPHSAGTASSFGLQLPSDEASGSWTDIPPNWGFSDLTDPANLADLGPLRNFPRSAFLPSYPDIDSPNLVQKYLSNLDMSEPSLGDEEKP